MRKRKHPKVPRMICTREDKAVLTSILDDLPRRSRVLEIGTCVGGTSVFFWRHRNVVEVITVDPFIDTPGVFTGEYKKAFRGLKSYIEEGGMEMLVMTSEEAFKDESLKDFDMIYIDGSHEYEDAKFDIESWQTRLKPDGFLVGHDYTERFTGVVNAVHAVLPECWMSHNIKALNAGPRSSVWCDKKIGLLTQRIEDNPC